MHIPEVSGQKTAVSNASQQSSSSNWFTRGNTESDNPPTQINWQLPPKEVPRGFSWSKLKAMLSYPLKFRQSLKRSGRSQNLQTVLEGVHDPNEEKNVKSFREMLFLEGQLPGRQNDYHTLLRFLRTRDFDLIKAKESFLQYLKWREEFGVDEILKEFKFEEFGEVKRCYPHGFHGVDRHGRPLYIERIGMVDLNAFLQVTTIDRFLKYHVTEQEKTLRWRYPACSVAANKRIASTISILDVKDVGVSNFSKPARNLFMEIQKIDSNYYPETMHRLFIVNAGSGFRVLWKALKTFLDARTLAKIQVLGNNYRSNLVEVIDPSNLPIFLGGNCTCSESGDCLLSDKGPWKNPDFTEMLQAMVDTEEEYKNGEKSDLVATEAFVSDMGNSHIKDVYNVSPPEDGVPSGLGNTNVVDKPLLLKTLAFEAALEDAKRKIRTLEDAIVDVRVVLQELTQHIGKLKG